MSYKQELEQKYAAIKNRMYAKRPPVINDEAIKIAQQMIATIPMNTIEDIKPPAMVGGVAGPTGVVIPTPTVKSGLTPLVDARQNYINMLNWVAHKHGLNPSMVQNGGRQKHLVAARHEIWWRIRTEFNYSFPRIARFARKDHSTIIHAVQTFSSKMLDSQEAQVQSDQTA